MEEDRYGNLRRYSAESNSLVRDCLKGALLTLIREKSYKGISVSELCRKAGVSRMAFYRNYGVIDDLFREAAEDLSGEILRAAGSLVTSSGFRAMTRALEGIFFNISAPSFSSAALISEADGSWGRSTAFSSTVFTLAYAPSRLRYSFDAASKNASFSRPMQMMVIVSIFLSVTQVGRLSR